MGGSTPNGIPSRLWGVARGTFIWGLQSDRKTMFGAVLEALGLWALVLAGGMALTSVAASALGVKDDRVLAAVSQVFFIALSLALARLTGVWGGWG